MFSVNVDYVGRDGEKRYGNDLVKTAGHQCELPLILGFHRVGQKMEPPQRCWCKCISNSTNLRRWQ